MKPLLREVEERYGVARGILLPVVVTPHQVEMLRAAERESEQSWNFMLLLFAGAHLLATTDAAQSQALRLPEFRLPCDILDLTDFEEAFKTKIAGTFGLDIELSHYLLMAHCTFMATGEQDTAGDDVGTSSRTLHVFTARALNSDELEQSKVVSPAVRLVKPAIVAESLQAEWADIKTQLASGGSLGDLRAEYDNSWAFVRVRVVTTAFHNLFGWPMPEI